ncbi:hypothetical protein D3C87_1445610 [compost metagenome]
MQQAVAADVDKITRLGRYTGQVLGGQITLGADVGHEAALRRSVRDRDAQTGIAFGAISDADADTFRVHRVAGQIAKAPGAMPTEVHHRQPVALGGGHHIEAATGFETG